MKGADLKKKGLGTFLAQGVAGNAFAIYLPIISFVFYWRSPDDFLLTVILPIYMFMAGIVGALVGVLLWLSERLLKRRLGIISRVAIGSLFIFIVSASLSRSSWIGRVPWESLVASLLFGLPAALMAGSRFNPMRALFLGCSRAVANRTFGSGFSFPPALIMRVLSLFGLLESLLYLACLATSDSTRGDTEVGVESLVGTIVAIFYFSATALASFTSPRMMLVLATAVIANAPLLMWALYPIHYTSIVPGFLAFAIWVLAFLWMLLVAGRMIVPDKNSKLRARRTRILPVTMFEIEIRHALNRW